MERILALIFGEKRKAVAVRYWRLMRFQWSLYALGEGRSHPRGCTRVSVSYCCRRHLEEVLSCQCELEGEAFSTHTLSFILLPTWLRNGGRFPYLLRYYQKEECSHLMIVGLQRKGDVFWSGIAVYFCHIICGPSQAIHVHLGDIKKS